MTIASSSAYANASDAMELARSLLMDADTPGPSTIAPSGLSRIANIVTVTTLPTHGLQLNDVVYISGTRDASFQGTFHVTSVPSQTMFTFNQTGADGSSGDGVVTEIVQGDVYTDAVLIPFVNVAYRKVQRRLNVGGSRTMTKVTDYNAVAALTTEFTDTSTRQLPPDFVAAREMWEKTAGSDTWFRPAMQPVTNLPSCPQGLYNNVYAWREDGIYFLGATQSLDFRLRYMAGFGRLSAGDSQILIRDGLDAVAFLTAALAAQSRGSGASATLTAQGEEALNDLKTIQAKASQYQSFRRRPYGGARWRCW